MSSKLGAPTPIRRRVTPFAAVATVVVLAALATRALRRVRVRMNTSAAEPSSGSLRGGPC